MDKQKIVFIYKETFSKSSLPFSKVKLENKMLQMLSETFQVHGGTYLLDLEISVFENWRISFWKKFAGYSSWQDDKRLKSYFKLRSAHNRENNIKTELIGPFAAKELLNV